MKVGSIRRGVCWADQQIVVQVVDEAGHAVIVVEDPLERFGVLIEEVWG